MALKIELKPNERIMLGDCVVTNSGHRTRLMIDGSLPILREKEIMSLGRAEQSWRSCIYLAMQFMYLSKTPGQLRALLSAHAREFSDSAQRQALHRPHQ